MADADLAEKAANRAAALTRLPSLQSDIVLLAVIAILLGYFAIEQAHYWQSFEKDHLRFKILVAWLAFLEMMFFAIRFSGSYLAVTSALTGGAGYRPGFLSIWSIAVTTCIEATSEGFFVYRLWLVTERWWMKIISVTLWLYSFVSHCVWVGLAGRDGSSSILDGSRQLVIVQIAFWATFIECSFVASCLIYELQFAEGRAVIKRNTSSSAIGQLVSLAMRTSGILLIFELIVAVAVSVQSQPPRALLIEVDFAATIYTVLAATIVIFTLNWRATVRVSSSAGVQSMAPPQPGESIRTPTFMRSLSRTGEGYGMGSRRRSSRGGGEWPGGVSVQTVTTSVSHTHDDGDGEGLRAGEDDGVGERTEGRTLELVELPATSDFLSPLGWKAKERLAKDSIADGDLGRTADSPSGSTDSAKSVPRPDL
ncbi:hypothetical protein Rhopal_003107-T1 [Rhodotorula paludigena]|uniref:Uncharacterized protein n=1 Tax=Rhodotorula paludigena TaxID=86838 RepID=A0AAV5GIR6_9BASI|nr:hypothetical protein Rhopal_003107-T1 [Rhodotorula paludigena]